ncbi:MAG: 6-bladed beta-propeller [Parabacteroides sp.]|nr:6-bladed beta-propeller [Parabacteroides sp.]
MKRIVLLHIVALCLFVSCSDKHNNAVLLNNFTTPKEEHPEWTALFTGKYEITPLETTTECLVGQIDKIVKIQGHYYISSSGGQSILHFNEQGKFVSTLNKSGQGPEEYHRIEDFDVYEIDGSTEVWISDNHSLKIYDASDFSFKYQIPYSFMIHKFKRLDNSHILLVTGQSEKILTLTDKAGNILSEYLKKKIPYIMFRPVQFVACGSDYLFQLGISNAYVAFNPETETFREGIFSQDKSYLSKDRLLESFNINRMDFILDANRGSYINNLVSLRDIIWAQTHHAGKNFLTKSQDGQTTSTGFTYGSILSTISVGESDNSVLLYATPDQLSDYWKDIFDKFGNKVDCQQEDNPCIVEFF